MTFRESIVKGGLFAGCAVGYLIFGVIICATLPLWINKNELNRQMGSENNGETVL